jgi:hypothetical protein
MSLIFLAFFSLFFSSSSLSRLSSSKIEDSLRTQEKIYDKLDRNFEELRRDKEEDEKNKL